MAQFDYLKTKDQLGRPDSTGLLVKKVTDSLNIEDRPLIIYKDTLDEIERWNLTTWNGGIWYGTVATSANMVRVVNRNNTHYERFINNNLKDVPNTTGTWDITNKRIVLTDGQQAQNLGYFKNEVNITNSKIIVSGDFDNAILYLSSDGTTFEEVTNNVKNGFTTVGQTGKWKIVASGDTVTADQIIVEYNK